MKRPKPSRPALENGTQEGGTAATVRVATKPEREWFDILANLGLVRSALLALLPDHFPHLSLPDIKERLHSRPRRRPSPFPKKNERNTKAPAAGGVLAFWRMPLLPQSDRSPSLFLTLNPVTYVIVSSLGGTLPSVCTRPRTCLCRFENRCPDGTGAQLRHS